MRSAIIYAGTFDPITFGHLDLIERAADIFERVVLAIAVDVPKHTLFSVEERVLMATEVVRGYANVEVTRFSGLLVAYATSRDMRVLLRGIRAYSDFEYEFQMALTNRKLAPEIETLFMMPKEVHSYVSSSSVKEIAQLGGAIGDFVPPFVEENLRRKFPGPERRP